MALGLAAFLAASWAPEAAARLSYGPVTLGGNVETQNILRVPELDQWSFVMQRNTLRLEYEHRLLDKGMFLGLADLSGMFYKINFFTYYRLVYDTIYDLGPGPRLEAMDGSRAQSFHGVGQVGGIPGSRRTDYALENNIRELYVDMDLAQLPVSFRLGKQQIVWGNANLNQRALDSINALDLTWHFNIESGLLGRVGFSELRRTSWAAKMIVNFGDIGPLGNVFLEAYDIPFEFHQTKARQLPAPWSAAFRNPVRPGLLIDAGPGQGLPPGILLLQPCFDLTGNPEPSDPGTDPGQQDFSETPFTGQCNTIGRKVSRVEEGLFDPHDPFDVNQVGARIGAMLPYSIGLTLNYMYRRSIIDVSGTASSRQPAAAAFAESPVPFITPSLEGVGSPTHSSTDPVTGETTSGYVGFVRVPLEFYMPYVHVFGVTLDYFEDRFLQGVVNAEMAWTHNNPIAAICAADDAGGCPDPMGVRRTDMVLAAVSLDRPTWIRPLNKGRVFDVQTQLNVGWQPFHDDRFQGSVSTGNKSIPGAFLEEPVHDNLEELTLLSAIVVNTTYWGGSLIPVFAWVSDWSVAPMFRWDFILQYLPNPYVILETQFRVFWTDGKTVFDRFGQGQSRRRDELILKATYQF